MVGLYTIRGLHAQELFEQTNPMGEARQTMMMLVSKARRRA